MTDYDFERQKPAKLTEDEYLELRDDTVRQMDKLIRDLPRLVRQYGTLLGSAEENYVEMRKDRDAWKARATELEASNKKLDANNITCALGPVGVPGQRDPEFPCCDFTPGKPHEYGHCYGDGHYLCEECGEMRSRDEEDK